MGKRPQVKKPAFEVKPSKNSQIWSVLYINKNNRRISAFDFASEKAAQEWINFRSKAWLKTYERNRV
jgi:hypothetical protein